MATWIIGGALAVIIGAIIWKMLSDRRKGKRSCGYNCEGCHGCCPNSTK